MAGFTIQTNMASIVAKNKMKKNIAGLKKSSEKLGSGYKINRAGDNASGLAVSEKMRSQIRGLSQAADNAKDGISLIQTAEGGLNETHAILQRMRELTVQASNGTYAQSDRKAIQLEIDALKSEMNRISEGTEFNGTKLLDGSLGFGFKNGMTVDDSGMYGIYGARYGTSEIFVAPEIHEETTWEPVEPPLWVPTIPIGKPDRPAGMPPAPVKPKIPEMPEVPGFDGTATVCGDFKVYGKNENFSFDETTGVLTIKGSVAIEGKNGPSVPTTNRIVVEKDADAGIALKNINIDVSGTPQTCAFEIENNSKGNVKIGISDVVNIKSGEERAGIQKNADKGASIETGHLMITGSGVLNVHGGYRGGAGIGAGGKAMASGVPLYDTANIVIDMDMDNGGTINTYGGVHSSGIGGGGDKGDVYNLTIKNGTINAYGASGCGSGIGGGHDGNAYNISIEGGNIYAKGGGDCPGLGSGMKYGENIEISGGKVYVEGGTRSEGIGASHFYDVGGDSFKPFMGIVFKGKDTEIFAVKGVSYAYDIGAGFELYDGLVSKAGTTHSYIVDDGMGNKTTVTRTGTLIKFDEKGEIIEDHPILDEIPEKPVEKDPSVKPEPTIAAPNTKAHVISNVGGVEVIAVNGASGEEGENAFWDDRGKTLTLNLVAGKFYSQSDIDKIIENANTSKGEINAPAEVRMILDNGFYIMSSDAWKSGKTTAGIRAYTSDVDLSKLLINGANPNDRYADTIRLTANGYGQDNRHIDLYVDAAPGKEYVEFTQAAEQYEEVGIKAGLTKLHLATGVEYTEEDIEKILAKAGFDYTVTLFDKASPDGDKVFYAQTMNSDYICLALQGGQGLGKDKILQTGEILTLQIGANGVEDQQVALRIDDMSSSALKVDTVVIEPLEEALKSIDNVDNAIKTVSSQRAGLGAMQNRLEYTVSNLMNSGENLTAAESQIRDTNMATEMIDYTKSNILQQASQAVMAQANQQPEFVLQLLGNQ